MTKIQSYKELVVWQKSIILVKEIYKITKHYPKAELFALVSQIRRAVISIPSNIAEGYGRRSHKEYLQFYSIAYGSALEVETQLILSKELNFITQAEFNQAASVLTEVIKMLYVMVFGKRSEKSV